MLLSVTTPPVKRQFWKIRRFSRLVKLKNTLIKKAERAKKLEARKKSKTKEQVSIQDSDGEAVSG